MDTTSTQFIPKQYLLKARLGIALEANGCKWLTDMMYDFAIKVRAASSRSVKAGDDGWVPIASLNRMYSYGLGQKTSDSTRYRNIKILRDANLLEHGRGRVRWLDTGTISEKVRELGQLLHEDHDPIKRAARFRAEA